MAIMKLRTFNSNIYDYKSPRLTLDRCKDALYVNLSRLSRLSQDLILQFFFRHPWPNYTFQKKKTILSVLRFDVLAEVTDQ